MRNRQDSIAHYYTDMNGRFPEDDNCDEMYKLQLLPTEHCTKIQRINRHDQEKERENVRKESEEITNKKK